MKSVSVLKMKELEIEILDYFHHYCCENRICYFLWYGSLLGAVRHNGFIPWDDDIDVAVPRSDYERLIKEFNAENKSDFRLITADNNTDYYLPYAKIINTKTILREEVDSCCEIGVYIDVFPLDNLGRSIKEAQRLLGTTKRWRVCLDIKNTLIVRHRKWYKNIILRMGKLILATRDNNSIARKVNDLAKQNNERGNFLVGNMVLCTYKTREIMRREWIEKRTLHSFETHMFYIPKGHHEILEQLYGDYMKPPSTHRITHHSSAAYMID